MPLKPKKLEKLSTKLFECIKKNDVKGATKILTDKGADEVAKQKNASGQKPIFLACTKSWEVTKLLLSLGADVNATTAKGTTPLHQIASHGGLQYWTDLLAAGGNPNKTDKKGWTPLMYATDKKRTEMVKLILTCKTLKLNKRSSVAYNSNPSKSTCLHIACRKALPEIVSAFLDDPRIDLDVVDSNNKTAYQVIGEELEKPAILKLFESHGVGSSSSPSPKIAKATRKSSSASISSNSSSESPKQKLKKPFSINKKNLSNTRKLSVISLGSAGGSDSDQQDKVFKAKYVDSSDDESDDSGSDSSDKESDDDAPPPVPDRPGSFVSTKPKLKNYSISSSDDDDDSSLNPTGTNISQSPKGRKRVAVAPPSRPPPIKRSSSKTFQLISSLKNTSSPPLPKKNSALSSAAIQPENTTPTTNQSHQSDIDSLKKSYQKQIDVANSKIQDLESQNQILKTSLKSAKQNGLNASKFETLWNSEKERADNLQNQLDSLSKLFSQYTRQVDSVLKN